MHKSSVMKENNCIYLHYNPAPLIDLRRLDAMSSFLKNNFADLNSTTILASIQKECKRIYSKRF